MDPARSPYGTGNTGSQIVKVGSFNTAGGAVNLQPGEQLWVTNKSTTVITLTGSPRYVSAGATFAFTLGVAKYYTFDGDLFNSFTCSVNSVLVQWIVTEKGAVMGGGMVALNGAQDSVQVTDAGGNTQGVPFVNSVAAGANGILHFAAYVTSGGVTISDGTSGELLCPVGTPTSVVSPSTYYHFTFPVTAGTTYTIGGTGIYIATGAVITPA